MASQKYNILYGRLSQEDERQGESNSIHNQKLFLEKYAADNGFENTLFLADDGYSGTNFERPAWKKIVEMIENGEVERYARQGAAAGFFFFEGFDGVDAQVRSERAKAFLEDFRRALAGEAGGSHFFCGLGVGLHRFYADVCIWNLHPLMDAAQAFLERHPEIRRAGWHTFRRAAGSVMLREPEETPAA